MGRPATTFNAATKLWHGILTQHPKGVTLATRQLKTLIVRTYRVGINQADNILKTGEAAGYWTRSTRQGVAGECQVLPPTTPPEPPQERQSTSTATAA